MNDSKSKTLKTTIVPKTISWKNYLITISKIVLVVGLVLITFDYFKNTTFGSRLKKVNTEVWITLTAASIGAIWKFYTDNERNRILTAQANAQANAEAIKALDRKVDSVVVQLQDLRSIQLDDTEELEKLEDSIVNLKMSILEQRHQFLTERVELVKEFHKELCNIHTHITYSETAKNQNKIVTLLENSVIKNQQETINEINDITD